MKTLQLIFLSIFCLTIVSCEKTDNGTVDNEFKKDLIAFGTETKIDLFVKTKAGSEKVNSQVLDMILNRTAALSEKYKIAKSYALTGFFTDLDERMAAMDFYETVQYLEKNSTPEFFRLLTQTILEEETLDKASIIEHAALLQGEKIALIVVNNVIQSHLVVTSKATKEQCQAAWDKGMADCRNRLYWKIGATTLFTFVNPILGTITGGATALDHDKCTTTVNREYNICMGNATQF